MSNDIRQALLSRRRILLGASALGAASGVASAAAGGAATSAASGTRAGRVITPNGRSLPWKMQGGAKVFHLIAGEIEHEFAPGTRVRRAIGISDAAG